MQCAEFCAQNRCRFTNHCHPNMFKKKNREKKSSGDMPAHVHLCVSKAAPTLGPNRETVPSLGPSELRKFCQVKRARPPLRIPGALCFLEGTSGGPQGEGHAATGVLGQSVAVQPVPQSWRVCLQRQWVGNACLGRARQFSSSTASISKGAGKATRLLVLPSPSLL